MSRIKYKNETGNWEYADSGKFSQPAPLMRSGLNRPGLMKIGKSMKTDYDGTVNVRTYVLNWYDSPTQSQKNDNKAILEEIQQLDIGEYRLFLYDTTCNTYHKLNSFYKAEGAFRFIYYFTDILNTCYFELRLSSGRYSQKTNRT